MKNRNIQSIIDYCDGLTSNGAELSVTWNGGGDDGYFDVLLDGKPLDCDPELKEAIIDLIDDHLDYGSFAGDFSTEGSVVYHRGTKSFTGIDAYSDTDYTTKDCKIEFSVPEALWFDSIELELEVDRDMVQVNLRFIILNGPVVEMHEEWTSRIRELVEEQLNREIEDIENFASIMDSYRIERKNLTGDGLHLQYTIGELGYSYDNEDDKEIEIVLTDKLYEHDKA